MGLFQSKPNSTAASGTVPNFQNATGTPFAQETQTSAKIDKSEIGAWGLDFPFLNNEETITYLKGSKVVFIMRGLPGSGKSTIVRNIARVYCKVVVCSADSFLMQDGKYNWTPENVKLAHKKCQEKAVGAMSSNENIIVIDNTNINYWEMNPYFKMANSYGYITVVVETKTPWSFNAEELERRNSHGVSLQALQNKLSNWKNIIPLYYAWFLNNSDSKVLSALAYSFLLECVTIDAFNFDFMKYVDNIEDVPGHFYSPNAPDDVTIRHCTSFFSAKGKVIGAENYAARVKPYLGEQYELTITAFIITPRTFGARVKLSEKQAFLWDAKNDEKDLANIDAELQINKKPYHGTGDQPASKKMKFASAGESSCIPTLLWSNENLQHNFKLGVNVGQRAHITLGVAHDIKPVQTGLDLLEVIKLSENDTTDTSFNVYNGSLKNYGNGQWVIFLNKPIKVNSLFSAYY